ncbi:MAG: heme-binding domain-containing protein [Candidatus Acidiferrales bacterium]
MKIIKTIVVILAILFVAAQFVRPARTNPPVDRALDVHTTAQVPAEVSGILKRSCYDCHSNETDWPWYTEITPINWWIVDTHVEHGREHYNYNEWGRMTAQDRDHILDEICEEVEAGAMPIPSYLIVHRDARLSESDKRALCDWTKAERARLAQPPAPVVPPSTDATPATSSGAPPAAATKQ